MDFWRDNVDKILELNNKLILKSKGLVSNKLMEKKVREVYNEFDARRKVFEAQQADEEELEELKRLEEDIKNRNS